MSVPTKLPSQEFAKVKFDPFFVPRGDVYKEVTIGSSGRQVIQWEENEGIRIYGVDRSVYDEFVRRFTRYLSQVKEPSACAQMQARTLNDQIAQANALLVALEPLVMCSKSAGKHRTFPTIVKSWAPVGVTIGYETICSQIRRAKTSQSENIGPASTVRISSLTRMRDALNLTVWIIVLELFSFDGFEHMRGLPSGLRELCEAQKWDSSEVYNFLRSAAESVHDRFSGLGDRA
jgi:hypothetical protein